MCVCEHGKLNNGTHVVGCAVQGQINKVTASRCNTQYQAKFIAGDVQESVFVQAPN